MNCQSSPARALFRAGPYPEGTAGSGIKIEQNRHYRDEGKKGQIKVGEGNMTRKSYKASQKPTCK